MLWVWFMPNAVNILLKICNFSFLREFLAKVLLPFLVIVIASYPLSANSSKMVKDTKTTCQLLPTNCLNFFDHFVGLALKRVKDFWFYTRISQAQIKWIIQYLLKMIWHTQNMSPWKVGQCYGVFSVNGSVAKHLGISLRFLINYAKVMTFSNYFVSRFEYYEFSLTDIH